KAFTGADETTKSRRETHFPWSPWSPCFILESLRFDLQDGEERLLGDLDVADLLHALLAGLLLLQQLALARDVAAVALGDHVLAHRLHRLARDDLRADRRLDRDLELLARDLSAQPLDQRAARGFGLVLVDDHRESVDQVAGQKDVHLDEVAGARP